MRILILLTLVALLTACLIQVSSAEAETSGSGAVVAPVAAPAADNKPPVVAVNEPVADDLGDEKSKLAKIVNEVEVDETDQVKSENEVAEDDREDAEEDEDDEYDEGKEEVEDEKKNSGSDKTSIANEKEEDGENGGDDDEPKIKTEKVVQANEEKASEVEEKEAEKEKEEEKEEEKEKEKEKEKAPAEPKIPAIVSKKQEASPIKSDAKDEARNQNDNQVVKQEADEVETLAGKATDKPTPFNQLYIVVPIGIVAACLILFGAGVIIKKRLNKSKGDKTHRNPRNPIYQEVTQAEVV